MHTADGAGGPVAGEAALERRRPGRAKQVSPELIPLLRGEVPAPSLALGEVLDFRSDAGSDLRVAEGIIYSVLLGAALWVAIIAVAAKFL